MHIPERDLVPLRHRPLRNLAALACLTQACAPPIPTTTPGILAIGQTMAVQEGSAVAAVVAEGSSSVHSLVHVSGSEVPGSSNVLRRHGMHVTQAMAHGSFW